MNLIKSNMSQLVHFKPNAIVQDKVIEYTHTERFVSDSVAVIQADTVTLSIFS